LLSLGGYSQQSFHFDQLVSKGELPGDIVSPTYLTFEEALKDNLIADDKKLTKKSKKKFILSSSYYINDILTSGDIVFNDTVTIYLNKIKDLILKDFPQIKEKVRVYTYKSPMVNALATNEGVIFVTTGLLARLDSEAQLAYILSHEISHFVKKHPINSFVEERDLSKNDKSYKKLSGINKFKLLSKKSRETELEADSHGYNYFHTTTYNIEAAEQTFKILEASNKPYVVDGDLSINSFYDFQQKMPIDIFSQIETGKSEVKEEGVDEEAILFSSHPAIDERIKNAKEKNINKNGAVDFLISEPWFKHCKNISRAVNVTQLLNLGGYGEAFYYCYLLEKEFGEQKFLMKLKLRTLYEIAKVKKESNQINTNILGFDISKVGNRDAFLIALAYVKKYEGKYTASAYSNALRIDIIKELSLLSELDSTTINYRETYDNIKEELSESTKKESTEVYDFSYLAKDFKYAMKGRKAYYKHYWNTGKPIKDIIVIDPSWNAYDTRKGIHSINSEKQAIELDNALLANAKMNGVNMKLMSTNSITKDDVKIFNDRIVLINYLRSKTNDESNIVFYNMDELNRIMKDNNAEHIALMSINSVLNKKGVMDYLASGLTIGIIIGIPYGIYTLTKKSYNSFLFFTVYDIKNDNIDFLDIRKLNVNTNSMIINSYYYEYLKLLGKSRKLKK